MLFARAPTRACISRIPQLLSVCVCVRALKTWCFSWLCDYLTLHSKQRLHANDSSPNAENTDILNHSTDKAIVVGIV